MDDRDPLDQSFDPRTWMLGSAEDTGDTAPAKRDRFKAKRMARPPFFRAGATAVGILSLGATAAFLSRPDSATATQVAAALEHEDSDAGAGASVAGDQP